MRRVSDTGRRTGAAASLRAASILLGAVLALVVVPMSARAADLRLVTIATGAKTGVYYYVGGELCRRVNAGRWEHGIRCLTETTGGSIDNLRRLRAGQADFAIVQSDWQYNALMGEGLFEASGPDAALRAVASLYPEAFTIVARADSGIGSLSDLAGKRLDIGPPGSGSRATMEVVMSEMGWKEGDFAQLTGATASEVRTAICASEIDAAVFIIAHPNLAVEDMIASCGAELVPVDGEVIAALTEAYPYYAASVIAGGTYPDRPAAVPVFALAATLVSSTRTPPAVVYDLVKGLFGDLEGFRQAHPAISEFSPERMLSEGLSAPLHSGAQRFYREEGLQ